jgi:LacI family transcriptional regulator
MTSRPVTIALFFPRQGMYCSIATGFAKVAAAHGWLLRMIYPVGPHKLTPEEYSIPDIGVVAPPSWHSFSQASSFQLLSHRQIVAVDLDLSTQNIPSILVDHAAIGKSSAYYLAAKNLKSYGCYSIREPWSDARAASFQKTIRELGHHYVEGGESFVVSPEGASPEVSPSYENIRRWLDRMPKPAGILGCCDAWAQELISISRYCGYQVPQDIAVLGVDNDQFLCETSYPPLSSVVIPWERLGEETAHLVHRYLGGESPAINPVFISHGGIFTRRSTDIMAVEDVYVKEALGFIRAHASENIDVEDVLKAVHTSRRSLERRFRQSLNCTIKDEIRRVHLEEAKRLLSVTNLGIEEIAIRSGFRNARRLDEVFARQIGISPLSYRQQFQLRI